jgi:hypothetical protein
VKKEMTYLRDANVYRGGVTAPQLNRETTKVRFGTYRNNKLGSRFRLASKGGGTTQVLLTIGPKDFPLMLSAMIDADRASALAAMTATLAAVHAKRNKEG